jgi:site-specific DNA recombinase
MNNAVIYARVSTDAQAERNTIETQLIDARDFAEAKGYPVVDEFTDEGVSGTIALKDRPAGRRLLEAAANKVFDHVIVYCADRLGRDTVEALLAMGEFKQLKVVVEFVSQSFDDTPEGEFMFTMMMGVATLERKVIARRMGEGRYRAVEKGAYISNVPPYGYQRSSGLALEPHPWEAGIVRWVYAHCLAGEGIQEIADQLQERGVPVPNHRNVERRAQRWHHTMVYRILTSPRYAGKATYAGRPMACPELVDEDTQMAAKSALKRRRIHSGPKPKGVYALKGKCFCRRCGSLYYVSTKGSESGGKAKYRCGSRVRYRELAPSHEGVYKTHWPADELEGRVLEFLQRAVGDPENLLREAVTYEQRAYSADTQQVDVEERLRALLCNLDSQHERALKTYVRMGGFSQVLDAEVARIARERADIETQISHLERFPDAERFLHYVHNLRSLARVITAGKAGYTLLGHPLGPTYPGMHKLIDRVWVEDDGSLTIEGAIPGVIPPPDGGENLDPPPGATAWPR